MSRYLILFAVPVACAAPDVTAPPPSSVLSTLQEPARVKAIELPDPEDAPLRRRELERDLIAATREGNYARVRELVGQLEELEIQPLVDQAHALLGAGDPEGALAIVERALEVAPDGPSARLVHGQAALAVGRSTYDTALMEAALASFQAASVAPPRGGVDRWYRRAFVVHALKGATEASRALGRKEQALEFAALELKFALDQKGRRELYQDLDEWPERTFVQAAYDVFVDVREAAPERAAGLVTEMERHLSWLRVAREEDPWAWSMLAAVQLEEGRFQDAMDTAEDGLGRAPGDRTLPGQLAEAARGVGGSDAVLDAFARLRERQPDAALAWWYPAYERFDAAVTLLDEEPLDELRVAETDFRRCRELEPEYEAQCLGFEAMCRNAAGWIHYHRGDLEAAADAFRSMEELFPRGMTWEIEDRLLSGVDGLSFVADAYANRDDLIAAARLFLELHRYQPDEIDWANNAGFFHRDAGARLESYAAEAASMAGGELKSEERRVRIVEAAGLIAPAKGEEAAWREVLEQAAAPLRDRSLEMFETSYESYLVAAELAPDDVRVVNDTALIPVHYLDRDLDRAERYLMRCVELGTEQLADTEGMGEEERLALTEAFGDAHENLGVLHLKHRNDPTTARKWFERSVEIGPNPRPVVLELYLPLCEAR